MISKQLGRSLHNSNNNSRSVSKNPLIKNHNTSTNDPHEQTYTNNEMSVIISTSDPINIIPEVYEPS